MTFTPVLVTDKAQARLINGKWQVAGWERWPRLALFIYGSLAP